MLSRERIAAELASKGVYGRSLTILELTDSTNDDAKRAAAEGASRGHVVVADGQRAGRGAHGRIWSSPNGVDLYVSIVERLAIPIAEIAPLTLAVGLGVAEAIEALAPGLAAQVKWPNDVRIGERKIAGILVETSSTGASLGPIVIGIGLGVNRLAWDDELSTIATSIRRELVTSSQPSELPIDRSRALAVLLSCVERSVDRFVEHGAGSILRALEPRLALRHERVRCDSIEGMLRGLAPSGAIRIETAEGMRELVAGTLRGV